MKAFLMLATTALFLTAGASAGEPIGALAALQCLGFTAKHCEPGASGQGGCYDPARAICQDGRICQAGLSVCKRGPNGPGGCYRAAEYRCELGAIRSKLERTGTAPR